MERSALVSAMAGLPAEQLRTVRLSYFAGQSHSQIALATNVPLGTVKSRLRTALRRLRLILGAGVQP
jgi:RNA polymerase sigma-70 factor (ECF subfamily)